MLKLYRTRFTAHQLRALSRHCYAFCPEGHAPMMCERRECDLQRLAAYAADLADEQEAAIFKK